MILLGVSEDKDGKFQVTGIEEADRVLSELWTQLNNPQKVSRNLLTDASVTKHPTEGGRWVLEIEVPRADRKQRPVFVNGNPLTGTYKRLHSADFRCREDEVRRMLSEQTEDARDARLLEGYDFSDIDMTTFKAYRNRLAALKPDHPYNTVDNPDLMRKLGGSRKDRSTGAEGLSLAGLLMFGKQEAIQEAVRNYFVDYRELPVSGSKTEWTDRLTPDGTWSGNLYDFYRLSIQRLFRDLKVPFRLEGDEREDDTPVHKALREALVNAIVHADYAAGTSILVVKAPDYFSFRNPGKMRIPVSEALEGGHSDCRNRNLQKMFSLIGLGEQAGSGIPRMLENWKSQHYRLPELSESDEPETTLMRLRTVRLLPESVLEELRQLFGAEFDGLAENSRLTVATAQIEGFVTNARLQQITRLQPRDITALLKALVDGGMLDADGKGRGTTYRITETEGVDLGSSAHLSGSSAHLRGNSAHLPAAADDPSADPSLREIAKPVSSTGKTGAGTMRQTILALCRERYLSVQQLAALLKRAPDRLRERFIKPMVEERLLERRYPQQPNHEKQAYRTRESSYE